MRIRKTARRTVLLLLAFFTFIVGIAAFYVYAEAAAFLFQPKQSAVETTQLLTPKAAAPPTFSSATVASAPQSWTPDDTCDNCVQDEECGWCEPVTGQYENYQYAYVLTVPDELRALKPPKPASDDGFIARLESDQESIIEVEGNYNDAEWRSLNEAVNAHIEYLKAGSKEVVVLKRNPARLGKRNGIRFVVQYTSIATGLSMIEDKTIALKKDETEDNKQWWTIYAVSLRTPASRYERNINALEKVLRRWKEMESDGC